MDGLRFLLEAPQLSQTHRRRTLPVNPCDNWCVLGRMPLYGTPRNADSEKSSQATPVHTSQVPATLRGLHGQQLALSVSGPRALRCRAGHPVKRRPQPCKQLAAFIVEHRALCSQSRMGRLGRRLWLALGRAGIVRPWTSIALCIEFAIMRPIFVSAITSGTKALIAAQEIWEAPLREVGLCSPLSKTQPT
jgi:hypothetical protein